MIEELKKQGLEQTAQFSFMSVDGSAVIGGIPRRFIANSRLELDHLICALCKNIIWKPVACGQSGCFSSFCEYCINNNDPTEENIIIQEGEEPIRKCPKCIKTFRKTSIPLLNTILSSLIVKCVYSPNGCRAQINYQAFLKHVLACQYRKFECEGCHEFIPRKQLQPHKEICKFIKISCDKCGLKLSQTEFKTVHNSTKCLEFQLAKKDETISQLESRMKSMKGRLDYFEFLMDKVIKGENVPLNIEFHTSFPIHFNFSNNEVRLAKASWNANKQKFDFLHFYITNPIKTESIIGSQWKLTVKSLQGNLLIGVCSSLCTNSVDFVINKFGQIKKKQWNQNKYKLVRKSCLTFGQSDVITFKYHGMRKCLKIENETKNVECKLDSKEISEIGENLYTFYSFDTCGDTVRFI